MKRRQFKVIKLLQRVKRLWKTNKAGVKPEPISYRFSRVDIARLFPKRPFSVSIHNPEFTHGEISSYELFCICAIVSVLA